MAVYQSGLRYTACFILEESAWITQVLTLETASFCN